LIITLAWLAGFGFEKLECRIHRFVHIVIRQYYANTSDMALYTHVIILLCMFEVVQDDFSKCLQVTMWQNPSSTPIRISIILCTSHRSLFRRLYNDAMSPCCVSKTDETAALWNVFRTISQRPSHTPNSHNRANRPWIHLRMHVNKRVYLYVCSRHVYASTISMCNNMDPEGSM